MTLQVQIISKGMNNITLSEVMEQSTKSTKTTIQSAITSLLCIW